MIHAETLVITKDPSVNPVMSAASTVVRCFVGTISDINVLVAIYKLPSPKQAINLSATNCS
ncbi:hypothetical protein MGSAQ_001231 [marine sediment metagenome]|uniref:Uncharacterized protein n=1 Tax=marine sediment metagenome TaxID=412755 RepID=A0A1B6NV81_9ZZZZ